MRRVLLLLCVFLSVSQSSMGQGMEAQELFQKMRFRLDAVKDYIADVRMKIDVSFMRIPTLYGKLYFKSPDKMKLERSGGISILPKNTVSLTLNNLVPDGAATVIDAGREVIAGKNLRVIKVVPDDDKSDIVLTKIWVDEAKQLAMRTETTTRENGTISMNLQFGKYADLALPDQVTFHVDVKEFKVPKGVAMDYDEGKTAAVQQEKQKGKPRKGTIRIEYLGYQINQGLSDQVFVEKK